MLDAKSLFSESYYQAEYPEVASAVASGAFSSGFDHFMKYGRFEGRNPSAMFDTGFYLAKYDDVNALVQKGSTTAIDQFIQSGQKEKRDPITEFNTQYYLGEDGSNRNADVKSLVEADQLTAYEHYIKYGQYEYNINIGNSVISRDPSVNFPTRTYLAVNPDVTTFLDNNKALKFSPIQHYRQFGINERRLFFQPVKAVQLQIGGGLNSQGKPILAPEPIVTGDFNGDGKLDLAVGPTNQKYLQVLLNNGNGTFQPPVNYSSGGEPPADLTVGDVNGDGKLDLLTANADSNNVAVLLGNGDGKFQPAVTYAVGSEPRKLIVGDFNSDGKLDIVTPNSTVTPTSIFKPSTEITGASLLLGNGNGTFQAATNYPLGIRPFAIAQGDFNKDSKNDIAVAYAGNNPDASNPPLVKNVSVLLGTGNGSNAFQSPQNYPVLGTGHYVIKTGQLTKSGNLDLVTGSLNPDDPNDPNGNNTVISVLVGNGNGTFQAPKTFISPGPRDLTLADVNSDGIVDILALNYNLNLSGPETPGDVLVYLGKGDGTFAPATNYVYKVGLEPHGITVGEFNGDGKVDLAVTNTNSDTISLLYGLGNGQFSATPI